MISQDLLAAKNSQLLQLEALKRAKAKRREIEDVASFGARLEVAIAEQHLADERSKDAAISFVSAASCLLDARRTSEATRLLLRAAMLVRLDARFSSWIASQVVELKDSRRPAEVFLTAKPRIDGNNSLRVPQIAAYHAAAKHFSESREHAIIQLPVGCGKTGAMAILPFGLAQGRALAIAPNREVRRNLALNFDSSTPEYFLKRAGVLVNGKATTCAVLDENANAIDADTADYVVTNIQQLVTAKSKNWLSRFAPDYFDLIFIDEGHHNVAPTWQEALQAFPKAKLISFTATPLRSDGRPVEGKRIYRFPIADAIRFGYVRDLASRRLEPAEIYFKYQGSEQRHSLAEVMKLREENWFSRGVALAPECNKHIVDASIQSMQELRSNGGAHHQIIAAACTIDHAKAIRSLYAERGVHAAVMHNELDEAEQDSVRLSLTNGTLDVVVQVSMFGEGADYPNLGVAAIFRPYRHMVPYVQFIGRVMRVLKNGEPGHPDNRGFVVSHVGLNVDRWWAELKSLDEDDQAFFEALANGDRDFGVPEEPGTGEGESRRRFRPEMTVLAEIVEHFVQESFLPEDREALLDDVVKTLELRGVSLEVLGITREGLMQRLIAETENRSARGVVREASVQPQRERIEARKRLDERVRSGAKELLKELGLSIMGRELITTLGVSAANNLGAAIVLLNLEVQQVLGVSSGEREDLHAEELKRVHDHMDELVDAVARRFRAKRRK